MLGKELTEDETAEWGRVVGHVMINCKSFDLDVPYIDGRSWIQDAAECFGRRNEMKYIKRRLLVFNTTALPLGSIRLF